MIDVVMIERASQNHWEFTFLLTSQPPRFVSIHFDVYLSEYDDDDHDDAVGSNGMNYDEDLNWSILYWY